MSCERVLLRAQEEVEATAVTPYYAEAYRAAETFYWSHIPFWMNDDFSNRKATRILDIGCAYGTLSLYAKLISGGDVYCTDFTDRFLSPLLVKRYDFHFRVNNIELDPFPWDLSFDAILLTEVLEHFNFFPVPTLTKITSHLAEGGRLYLSTPDAEEWGKLPHYPSYRAMPLPDPEAPVVDDHVYQYTANELFELVDVAGLKVLKAKYAPGCGLRHINAVLARQ